jgi:hypothetical protein
MISQSKKNIFFALIISTNLVIPASFAATTTTKTLSGGVKKTTVTSRATTWGQKHPKLKSAAIGGGIGAAAGGATGMLTGRGAVRGAAIGGGIGAGVGAARKTQIAKRHPIVSDMATGTAAGLGLGWASGREGMTKKGALIGGLGGLGVGLWKNRKDL